MYEQIARNKRRTILYIGVFILVWLGIGAIVGTLYDAISPGLPGAPSTETRDLVAGIALALVLAAAATAFTLCSGTRLVHRPVLSDRAAETGQIAAARLSCIAGLLAALGARLPEST